MEERYSRSIGTLTEDEINILKRAKVAVVGCGGLGGAVIEMLGRMGVGQLTVIDGDVFEASNLNRQLLSEEGNLGMSKAECAAHRMGRVNSSVGIIPKSVWLDADNSKMLLEGHDAVVDALDDIEVRFTVQAACKALDIPLIHGAIGGWYGQVCTIYPGDDTLFHLYQQHQPKGVEAILGNPSFTPFLVAALQCTETIKTLIGRGELLRHQVLRVDLLTNEYMLIPFSEEKSRI